MSISNIALNDGTSIPQLGFGTYQVPQEETADVVSSALEVGYRHIDTAQMYGNEAGVGAAIKDSGLDRGSLFVTTKLNNGNHEPAKAKESLERSLTELGLDRVDLFLIHWPLPTQYGGDFVSTWQALADLREAGLTTSIGVSNFQPAHLSRIVDETGVVPVVNQIEVHPYLTNDEARSANASHGIVTEAWSPIAQGKVLDDPTLTEIAESVGRSPAQTTLRWHIQRGDIIFPKTTGIERMRENFALFDFELSDEQVERITALDKGERVGPDPDTFDYIPS